MAIILVVNGDESSATLLSEFFDWQGHRTVRALTVTEAAAWIDGGFIDLLVTERIVPWPDGVCVPTVLGPACVAAGVPMLVWTADVLLEDRDCIRAVGARYLPKPSSLSRIGEVVAELLEQRKPAPA